MTAMLHRCELHATNNRTLWKEVAASLEVNMRNKDKTLKRSHNKITAVPRNVKFCKMYFAVSWKKCILFIVRLNDKEELHLYIRAAISVDIFTKTRVNIAIQT